MSSLREKLVGSWELVSYTAYLASDKSNVIYPLGPDAKGMIIYTSDGYMSAQLLTPGQPKFDPPGTQTEWASVGQRYVGYTGHFFLDEHGDEHGPMLLHHMRVANVPRLFGDTQRRLMNITDEGDRRYLTLSVAAPMKIGEADSRIPLVRWRRMPDNAGAKPPTKL
jgi:hypothetical protein